MAPGAVPPGWKFDAMTDSYINGRGLRITQLDIADHGDLTKAIIAIHGASALYVVTGATSGSNQMASPPGANGPAGPITASIMPNNPQKLTISNKTHTFHNPPTNVVEIVTKVGKIGINIETGDITIPPGIGRKEAIREFWLGFQEHFNPFDKAKYVLEIDSLKEKMELMKRDYAKAVEHYKKDSVAFTVAKIQAKYGKEKFIMVKPDDLIRFIEEA